MAVSLSTRRQLIGAGLAAGSGGSLLGIALTERAAAEEQSDPELARSTLSIELLGVFVYGRVLASGLLSVDAQTVVERIFSHERAHVSALTDALSARGGSPPPGPADEAAAQTQLNAHHATGSLAALSTEVDGLKLLIEVEKVAEGGYFDAMSKLSDPGLLRLSAEIMAAEAQHATALSELLHPHDYGRSVPDAFVEGTR